MKTILKIIFYAAYTISLFAIALFGGDSYTWVKEMDPSIPEGGFENTSNNTAILSALFLFISIIFCGLTRILAKTKAEKIIFVAQVFISTATYLAFSTK